MELEMLAQLHQEFSEWKRQRRSGAARSSGDIFNVEIPQSRFSFNKTSRNVTFVDKDGKPRVFPYPEKMASKMTIEQFEKCVCEVCSELQEADNCDMMDFAIDDLHGTNLPMEQVLEARHDEMSPMKGHTFVVVKRQECLDRTGKNPISTRWVDTDKSHGQGPMQVRSRFVATDFKRRGERDREDLFCATPPLELLRLSVSLMVTRSPKDFGRSRKMLFVDAKNAHLVPVCQEDVYIELPAEAECEADECGKLKHWLWLPKGRSGLGRPLRRGVVSSWF